MPRRAASKARRRSRDRHRTSGGPKLALLGKRGFQGLAAAVGLAIGVTQLMDWMWSRGDPAPAMVVRLEDMSLREETLGKFLYVTQVSAQTYEGEDRDQRGTGMSARLQARGATRTSLNIRWTLIVAATGRPVQGARWSRTFDSLYLVETLDEPVDCWVPPPPRRGQFLILLTAETPEGRVLARTRSEAFQAPEQIRR